MHANIVPVSYGSCKLRATLHKHDKNQSKRYDKMDTPARDRPLAFMEWK